MKKMLARLWYKYQTMPVLKRRVRRASLALIYVDDIMKQNRVPRTLRRQFYRTLWRRPMDAYEILERALYGRQE
jgi:hypothetical protein